MALAKKKVKVIFSINGVVFHHHHERNHYKQFCYISDLILYYGKIYFLLQCILFEIGLSAYILVHCFIHRTHLRWTILNISLLRITKFSKRLLSWYGFLLSTTSHTIYCNSYHWQKSLSLIPYTYWNNFIITVVLTQRHCLCKFISL